MLLALQFVMDNTVFKETFSEDRLAHTKENLTDLIKEAVADALRVHPLSTEEVKWVRLAIQAEAERAELRKAIIEKSLAALIWSGVVGITGYIAANLQTHWK